MENNIEIIGLIYKSTKYLKLLYTELKKDYTQCIPGWDIGIRIVGNDPSHDVMSMLLDLDIESSFYYDADPNSHYLSRVYRCWNYAGQSSEYDNICFVNSDMIFSDGWLHNLLQHHDGINIPTSRLVESGKMRSGQHGISYNFGRTPENFNDAGWKTFVIENKKLYIMPGGLFMPCVFSTKLFRESGGYPEGNVNAEGKNIPGDVWFFNKLEKEYGMKHITVFDSLVYHIQEGEMDE